MKKKKKKERERNLTGVNINMEEFVDPLGEELGGKSNKVMVNKIHKDKWNYLNEHIIQEMFSNLLLRFFNIKKLLKSPRNFLRRKELMIMLKKEKEGKYNSLT